MVMTVDSDWITDLVTMKCRNTVNNIVVAFEKNERILIGKIESIPLELLKKWGKEIEGEKNINNALVEAELVFLREYYANN
jgi:hypothetical protein